MQNDWWPCNSFQRFKYQFTTRTVEKHETWLVKLTIIYHATGRTWKSNALNSFTFTYIHRNSSFCLCIIVSTFSSHSFYCFLINRHFTVIFYFYRPLRGRWVKLGTWNTLLAYMDNGHLNALMSSWHFDASIHMHTYTCTFICVCIHTCVDIERWSVCFSTLWYIH